MINTEEAKKLKKQARENLKNYHARKSTYDKAGEVLLKKAEDAEAGRKKRTNSDTEDFCKDLAKGFIALATDKSYFIIPAGKKKKVTCCICGDGEAGTYYNKPDNRWYGSCCAHLYGANKQEVEEERKAICH